MCAELAIASTLCARPARPGSNLRAMQKPIGTDHEIWRKRPPRSEARKQREDCPRKQKRHPIRTPFPTKLSLMSELMSERFGRLERGGARGGVDSGQQTDRAANSRRKQGSERVEHRGPDLIRRDTH